MGVNRKKTQGNKRADKLRKLKFDAQVLEYRLLGYSVPEISTILRADSRTIDASLRRSEAQLKIQVQDDAEKLRAESIARLERLQRACWKQAMKGETKSIREAAKIERMRMDLLGLQPKGPMVSVVQVNQQLPDLPEPPQSVEYLIKRRPMAYLESRAHGDPEEEAHGQSPEQGEDQAHPGE